jgi:hypothetical protein
MKRFVDLGNDCVEYLKVAKASEVKSRFLILAYLCMPIPASLLDFFLSSLFASGALKAANARIASLESKLAASRTSFDAATTVKVNAEKSTKSALAKAKKAEKDLSNANKEHLQREQAIAERLNQMSAAAGGTYYDFLAFFDFLALLMFADAFLLCCLLFPWLCII